MKNPWFGERTRWLDLYFCVVPLFAGYQWFVSGDVVSATGMVGVAAVLLIFRPMIQPKYMGKTLSREDLQTLIDGETLTIQFSDSTLSLSVEKP